MSGIHDITLGDDEEMVQRPQPSRSRISRQSQSKRISQAQRGSRARPSTVKQGPVDLARKVKIEDAFFKVNYYWGESLDNEIKKVIPELTDRFKTKDDVEDLDDSMDMGDLEGMVRISDLLFCFEDRCSIVF